MLRDELEPISKKAFTNYMVVQGNILVEKARIREKIGYVPIDIEIIVDVLTPSETYRGTQYS